MDLESYFNRLECGDASNPSIRQNRGRHIDKENFTHLYDFFETNKGKTLHTLTYSIQDTCEYEELYTLLNNEFGKMKSYSFHFEINEDSLYVIIKLMGDNDSFQRVTFIYNLLEKEVSYELKLFLVQEYITLCILNKIDSYMFTSGIYNLELDNYAKFEMLNELDTYLMNNPKFDFPDILNITVRRDEIEQLNTKRVLNILKPILDSKDMSERYNNKVNLTITGFEKEKKELYEIEAVRKWIDVFDKEFPYWFYFIDVNGACLSFITLSLCKYEKRVNGGVKLELESFQEFLYIHFIHLNELTSKMGYNRQKVREIDKRIADYYDMLLF